MRHRERLAIYGLLGLLVLLNLHSLLGSPGSAATADPLPAPDDLGPADGLVLAGDEPLRLRNEDGQIAWDDTPFARAQATAVVHVGRVLGLILDGEAYAEERSALADELTEANQSKREELDELYGELQGMDQADPRFAEAYRLFDELRKGYDQWTQQAARREAELAASQMLRAYEEIVAAVDVVSEQNGIDLVLRFIPLTDEPNITHPEAARLLIRGRSVLKYPEELDITPDVLEELSLDD